MVMEDTVSPDAREIATTTPSALEDLFANRELMVNPSPDAMEVPTEIGIIASRLLLATFSSITTSTVTVLMVSASVRVTVTLTHSALEVLSASRETDTARFGDVKEKD
jgi:hypothetical protein